MFGTRVLGEFNPHFSSNFSVFYSNHNTLPLPSGLWMRFCGDWVKVGVSPNILKDYSTNLHKNSSTWRCWEEGMGGGGSIFLLRREHTFFFFFPTCWYLTTTHSDSFLYRCVLVMPSTLELAKNNAAQYPGFGSPGVRQDSTAWSWANPSPPSLFMAQI
jgi:hypothetical protein